jgi:hypothetical protein
MVTWKDASNGDIPHGAKPAGREATGEHLYAARAKVPGGGSGWQPGKVRHAFGGALIPFGGDEIQVTSYQVCMDPLYAPFVTGAPTGTDTGDAFDSPESGGLVPPASPHLLGFEENIQPWEPHAILCGQDADGSPLFGAVVDYQGGAQPGKVGLHLGGANISFDGQEIQGLSSYGVLCDESFGFAYYPGDSGTKIPTGSIQSGSDDDGAPLFLARSQNWNFLGSNPLDTPHPSTGLQLGGIRADGWGLHGARIPYAGKAYTVFYYSVLIVGPAAPKKVDFNWISAKNGAIPDGALVLGSEGDHRPLFAARAKYGSGRHVGKIRQGFGGAHIPYQGNEVTVSDYEVLVAPP